ncbi:MAG TPA: nicotinate (nicotinamide) nucleotide adenylyltransferase [Tepidisphaeraceae bacterium]|nr:nicotinate (nicotinamide) nucleotide adenylyltransferase [Tepidisphaeraceae bacterium]
MDKKTLCLGGSFNPIHHGHLICARAVAESIGFGRILIIPTGQAPHKPAAPEQATSAQRLQMCRLAIESLDQKTGVSFDVNDLEIIRPGPSYTLDTVRELRRQGWSKVHWLIGADMLNFLPKWHKHAELLSEADFLIMARPRETIDWVSLPSELHKLKNNVIPAPLIDISSTEIRKRVKQGLDITYLTPPAVVDFIHAHNLYRGS